MYTVASFFSGIGGLDLAFAWAGFDIRLQCEIDEYCQQVLKKWKSTYWHNAKIYGDIHDVTKTEVGNIDVIIGGFPCQDISIAGNRDGIKVGNRSGLWFELLRIIREVRPRVILLENVSAISIPTNGEPSPGLVVIASLAEIGYDCQWQFIRASDVGAPHRRERWFCLGYDNRYRWNSRGSDRQKRYIQSDEKRNSKTAFTDREQLQSVIRSDDTGSKLVNSNGKRQQKQSEQEPVRPRQSGLKHGSRNPSRGRAQSRLGRITHGLSRRLYRYRRNRTTDYHAQQFPNYPNEPQFAYEPDRVTDVRENRVNRIKALGNAVVPQQAYPFAIAIKNFLDTTL